MRFTILLSLAALCGGWTTNKFSPKYKVVCYWKSASFLNQGSGRFTLDILKLALPHCTHLIYGYAGINQANSTVMSLKPTLDLEPGQSLYKSTTQLKKLFPALKIYLSIGGNADPHEEADKYLTLIETPEARSKFIRSAVDFCTAYGFDGIDLAWPFPTIEVKKNGLTLTSIVNKIKEPFRNEELIVKNKTKHRQGFTALVRDLKNSLKLRGLDVTVTVLPNVDVSAYYEPLLLAEHINAVHLMAFDQTTPERNPKKADYPAPIYDIERNSGTVVASVNSAVTYWLDQRTPSLKIVLGIPTFGRTWRISKESPGLGVPPMKADGPGSEGPLTKTPGILSYGEICPLLKKKSVKDVQNLGDSWKSNGRYTSLPYDPKTRADGIWIGYEDLASIESKSVYAKRKNLGGVAIFDMSTDDFLGTCHGQSFPIVRAVKSELQKQMI